MSAVFHVCRVSHLSIGVVDIDRKLEPKRWVTSLSFTIKYLYLQQSSTWYSWAMVELHRFPTTPVPETRTNVIKTVRWGGFLAESSVESEQNWLSFFSIDNLLRLVSGFCLGSAGPGSPGPSIPIVPDLSPKKVSASHNVYVSPLRCTKVRFCAVNW